MVSLCIMHYATSPAKDTAQQNKAGAQGSKRLRPVPLPAPCARCGGRRATGTCSPSPVSWRQSAGPPPLRSHGCDGRQRQHGVPPHVPGQSPYRNGCSVQVRTPHVEVLEPQVCAASQSAVQTGLALFEESCLLVEEIHSGVLGVCQQPLALAVGLVQAVCCTIL